MPTFPNQAPLNRRYTTGRFFVTEEPSNAGSIRFRHGLYNSQHPLTLPFPNRTQQEARQLRNHYRDQKGSNRPFSLSSLAWAGHPALTDVANAGTLWKYAEPIKEDHSKGGGLVDVTISLVSVVV